MPTVITKRSFADASGLAEALQSIFGETQGNFRARVETGFGFPDKLALVQHEDGRLGFWIGDQHDHLEIGEPVVTGRTPDQIATACNGERAR